MNVTDCSDCGIARSGAAFDPLSMSGTSLDQPDWIPSIGGCNRGYLQQRQYKNNLFRHLSHLHNMFVRRVDRAVDRRHTLAHELDLNRFRCFSVSTCLPIGTQEQHPRSAHREQGSIRSLKWKMTLRFSVPCCYLDSVEESLRKEILLLYPAAEMYSMEVTPCWFLNYPDVVN